MFLNSQSAQSDGYKLFMLICSFTRTKQASCRCWLLKKKEKDFDRSFNFTFHYIDDILSLNNYKICDFVDCIYLIEVDITNTTDTARSASYLDLHLVPL